MKNITNTSKDKSNIVTRIDKNNGKFAVTTKANYEALTTKDPNTLYLIVDNVGGGKPSHNGGAWR